MLAVLKKILLDIVTHFNILIKTFTQTLIVIYQLTDLTTLQLPLKVTKTDSNPYHIHSENYIVYNCQIIVTHLIILIKIFTQTLIVIHQLTDLTTLQLPLKVTNTDSNPYDIHSENCIENYIEYFFQIILRRFIFYTVSGKKSSRDFYNGKKKTIILISNRYLDSTVRLANHKITMLLYNLFRKKEFNNGLLF